MGCKQVVYYGIKVSQGQDSDRDDIGVLSDLVVSPALVMGAGARSYIKNTSSFLVAKLLLLN